MQYRRTASEIFDGLTAAMEERVRPTDPIKTGQSRIRAVNPARWARLQRDVRWMKRVMKRKGMNPEDFRWLL